MEVRYSIILHQSVTAEDLPKLDVPPKQEVRNAVRTKLTSSPELYGKPLRYSLKGHRSLRVGNYLVVYRIEKKIVRIISIIHRSRNYKGVENRI
ncbi:MAG: Toxin-antitoxin system, toxin component, RelE family [Candidatus Kaiserbacteria bacterium GW2011_GWB1_52_6]|uniref:Toxin-antitoxin system, toxin component, RelE family n=3 Tax=Candidatus Kaiseribacteriota TaxID=1752734 RepID=A0A0G1XHQ9_9BACT|nr:MAG: Toxin-antitoxin system, toxin component, RelE family [Candidatus Kaiserbacteria bacterium GW2011_GWA2_52_12]KKW26467.1 MAG: Toxin-antitoxin system, toxin component, RelE family [Candidatus Kaiserbacteria bacterium GW2011_GWB1_52_6]KKW30445.1 MAG: Toxin-antitoxin system, toxin component, RelE family [Candidatus Kaiserbacteria bacterium GW2011_GWC2_52_8b]